MLLTNEEKRVEAYAHNNAPTVPSEVTPGIPLEDLNLNWREKDLPQRQRTKHVHGLHPYLGKFVPQLVEIFLRKYFTPGQTVLDPFCGSGTTLVQANELGVHSIGCDISAFNVLLCKVKTAQYHLKQAKREVWDILEKTRAATHDKVYQLSLWSGRDGQRADYETDDFYLLNWYASQARRELLTYRHYIEVGDYQYKDLLKVILSRAARSARLTTHFDLDFPKEPQTEPYWCYKHSRTCYPVQEACKFLGRYSKNALDRISAFAKKRTNAQVTIYHADSRTLEFPLIDGVITSPPYVGLIDYHEQHKYAYHLLGLQDRRSEEIGPAVQGASQKAREQYQAGIAEVFRNILTSMPAGGRVIVVAGDRHGLYGEIAEAIDVEVEGVVKRHVNRRTGRRSSEFYESIFIWKKV
jgi:hypothetical protein